MASMLILALSFQGGGLDEGNLALLRMSQKRNARLMPKRITFRSLSAPANKPSLTTVRLGVPANRSSNRPFPNSCAAKRRLTSEIPAEPLLTLAHVTFTCSPSPPEGPRCASFPQEALALSHLPEALQLGSLSLNSQLKLQLATSELVRGRPLAASGLLGLSPRTCQEPNSLPTSNCLWSSSHPLALPPPPADSQLSLR